MKEIVSLQNELQNLGYEIERQSLITSEILKVLALNTGEKLENIIVLNIFPKEEDDDPTIFIQFYFQFLFSINKENLNKLDELIFYKNRLLPLGHFNFSENNEVLYFKYILVMPTGASINQAVLSDVMNMVVYSMETHKNDFEGTNSLSKN
jgi:hypothetical protein